MELPLVLPSTVRSGPSRTRTEVRARNCTDKQLQCLWLNYQGEEVDYGTYGPGETFVVYTFIEHPWVFKEEGTGEYMVVDKKMIVFPEKKRSSSVNITQPQQLRWTKADHCRFPQPFRQKMRDLLLWHSTTRSFEQDGLRCEQDARDLPRFMLTLPREVLTRIVALSAPLVLDVHPAAPPREEDSGWEEDGGLYDGYELGEGHEQEGEESERDQDEGEWEEEEEEEAEGDGV